MTFLELAAEVLRQSKEAMTPKEIWEKAEVLGLTLQLNSAGKTPVSTLSARLSRHASLGKGGFEYASKKPMKFRLKGDAEIENDLAEIHENVFQFLMEKRKENPELRFLLRSDNRQNRLDKGYWFWGNEEYVTIAFWKGLDKKLSNRIISFWINKNGACTFALSATDSDNKALILHSISALISRMELKKYGKVQDNYWEKKYSSLDYIANLDSFLTEDKPKIDAILKTANPALLEDLQPIGKEEFDKNLLQIEMLRAQFEQQIEEKEPEKELPNVLVLQTISLQNIGLFHQLELKFGKRITILMGENGIGKTTLLRAIALGITGVGENRWIDVNDSALQNLLRIEKEKKGHKMFSSAGEITLTYQLNEKKAGLKNVVSFTERDYMIDIQDDANADFVAIEGDNFPNLVIGFPQIQANELPFFIKNTPFEKIETQGKPHLKDLLPLLYNKADKRLSSFSNWIVDLFNQENAKENSDRSYLLIHTIFDTISEIIGSKISFKTVKLKDEKENEDIVWVRDETRNQDIPLAMVSQGFNSVFGWLGYFMMRLKTVTPKEQDFTQANAVVLIDEIDTYLHPKWQKTMLSVLAAKFPNVQFIVTTHSPLVVSHLDAQQLDMRAYLVSPLGAREVYTSGKDLKNVLYEAFGGIETRADFSQKELDALYQLLENEPLPVKEIEQKLAKLREILGENDPDLVSIQATLNFLS